MLTQWLDHKSPFGKQYRKYGSWLSIIGITFPCFVVLEKLYSVIVMQLFTSIIACLFRFTFRLFRTVTTSFHSGVSTYPLAGSTSRSNTDQYQVPRTLTARFGDWNCSGRRDSGNQSLWLHKWNIIMSVVFLKICTNNAIHVKSNTRPPWFALRDESLNVPTVI